MSEVAGVKLSSFEVPIHDALREYGERTNGYVRFDLENAPKLDRTQDKPNSARSKTVVRIGEEVTADLFVIVFGPGDGTGTSDGDGGVYTLNEVEVMSPYPRQATRVLPRKKKGIHTEFHLNIATQKAYDIAADPVQFDGSYDLLGIVDVNEDDKKVIGRIGELGYPIVGRAQEPGPTTTMTVGFSEELNVRFGDPHSVYSMDRSRVQVCGFLAIPDSNADEANILRHVLRAQEPITETTDRSAKAG